MEAVGTYTRERALLEKEGQNCTYRRTTLLPSTFPSPPLSLRLSFPPFLAALKLTLTLTLTLTLAALKLTFCRPGNLNLALRSASMAWCWCTSLQRTLIITCPISIRATLPAGLPKE